MTERVLPEKNRLVVAFLDGWQEHRGRLFSRSGFAFMVRWPGADPEHVVHDDWSAERYEAALKEHDMDGAMITHWIYAEEIHEHMQKVDPS